MVWGVGSNPRYFSLVPPQSQRKFAFVTCSVWKGQMYPGQTNTTNRPYTNRCKKVSFKLPEKVHFQFPWLWTAGSWTGRQWWRRSCRSRRIRRSRWPSARSEQGPELASLPGRTSSCSAAWPAASASGESSSPGGRKWSWLSGSEFQLELVVFRTRQSQSGNHLLHGVIGWIWLNQPSRDTIRTLARLGISSLLPVSHQDP